MYPVKVGICVCKCFDGISISHFITYIIGLYNHRNIPGFWSQADFSKRYRTILLFLSWLLLLFIKSFWFISSDILVTSIDVKTATACHLKSFGKWISLSLSSNSRNITSSAWIDQCTVAKSSFPFLQKLLFKNLKENYQRKK